MKSHHISIVLLTAALLAGCGMSPESSIEDYYRSLEHGEITDARSHISAQLASMLGEARLSETLSGETERIRSCGGIRDINVTLQGEGEIRSGIVNVTYKGNCPIKNASIKLIKEDGKWKIAPSRNGDHSWLGKFFHLLRGLGQ